MPKAPSLKQSSQQAGLQATSHPDQLQSRLTANKKKVGPPIMPKSKKAEDLFGENDIDDLFTTTSTKVCFVNSVSIQLNTFYRGGVLLEVKNNSRGHY